MCLVRYPCGITHAVFTQDLTKLLSNKIVLLSCHAVSFEDVQAFVKSIESFNDELHAAYMARIHHATNQNDEICASMETFHELWSSYKLVFHT